MHRSRRISFILCIGIKMSPKVEFQNRLLHHNTKNCIDNKNKKIKGVNTFCSKTK